MRNSIELLIMAALVMVCANVQLVHAQGKTVLTLHKEWKFRKAGTETWHRATVPGDVHNDLLANKLIEDPFYRDNEKKLQWIGKTDWEYETKFRVAPALLEHENLDLLFKGLDTYATVRLNGVSILSADNMFRDWRVACKGLLKAGENTLNIVFRSPINEILPRMKTIGYELPASNDQGEKTSPYTRKAPYQFGWDWGPRFVTSGVWRPVYLEAWSDARISDFHMTQEELTKSSAKLKGNVEIVAAKAGKARVILAGEGPASVATQWVDLKKGTNLVRLDFTVSQPRLWWPNGMGAQNLYRFTVHLRTAAQAIDKASTRIGLRTLELRQAKDRWGKSFEFVINGKPVFAKGGNWIPADSFPTRITKEKYRLLLTATRDARMNMLRVWGGGIYESDDFYDLCDELGLMLWQDFMFACSMYPGDQAFLDNVRAEAVDNVVRLRSHPSIVLWCGNNEVETAWMHWGWKNNLPASLWDDYKKIFHGVLPEVVAQHDPSRPYWPSSPSSNLEEDPNSEAIGDIHYWGVWHASLPFAEYEKQFPRFMSEYGFQSFPQIETVNSYTIPADHDIQSPVMLAHQKHPRGNQLIREYMLRDYNEPKDFESFLYVSQVLQARGIQVAADHLRRIRPQNMGSLYWQINDCWPVASWSGIDYFGRWKALHYYARRFYADAALSTREKDGTIEIHAVSDHLDDSSGVITTRLMDFEGRPLFEKRVDIRLPALSSAVYLRLPAEELLKGRDRGKVFLHSELTIAGRSVSTSHHYFEPFKKLSLAVPALNTRIVPAGKAFRITVASNVLARDVYLSAGNIDGEFSDNFFDLIPGREAVIEFRPRKSTTLVAVKSALKARSIADAF